MTQDEPRSRAGVHVERPVDERRALASGLTAVALWSTVATVFELGLRRYTSLQLLWLGTLVSLGFFVAASLASGRARAFVRLPGRRLARLAALGALNPFAYYVILLGAYDRLPAQIAQPLNYTWAITLALLAVPVLGQRLERRQVVGMGVSYAGVVVLLTGANSGALAATGEVGGLDWLGVALALASTFVWAGYWLVTAVMREDALVQMTVGFASGALLVTIACGVGPGYPTLDAGALGFGAWIGLFEMGLTFLLWQRALALTRNAARIGQLIFLSPFLSLVLIQLVLGEPVQGSSVMGLAGIVAGLVIGRRREAGM